MTPHIPIFRNGINELDEFTGGVNLARDFTFAFHRRVVCASRGQTGKRWLLFSIPLAVRLPHRLRHDAGQAGDEGVDRTANLTHVLRQHVEHSVSRRRIARRERADRREDVIELRVHAVEPRANLPHVLRQHVQARSVAVERGVGQNHVAGDVIDP